METITLNTKQFKTLNERRKVYINISNYEVWKIATHECSHKTPFSGKIIKLEKKNLNELSNYNKTTLIVGKKKKEITFVIKDSDLDFIEKIKNESDETLNEIANCFKKMTCYGSNFNWNSYTREESLDLIKKKFPKFKLILGDKDSPSGKFEGMIKELFDGESKISPEAIKIMNLSG